MSDGGLLSIAFKAIIQIIKWVIKGLMFLGFKWVLVPCGIGLVLMFFGVAHGNFIYKLIDNLILIGFILVPFELVQNVYRMTKQDRTFNVYKALFTIFKKKKVGFTSKIDGTIVDGVNSNEVNGFVFGKKNGKYVTKPETTDGHILVIGGAGSGKTSGVAIPTLMSWKNPIFAIDIKGELYQKTKDKRDINNIKVFDPTNHNAYGYDPFYLLRKSTDKPSEARQLALAICPLSADVKDPFWIKSAQNMLTGLILYYNGFDMNFSQAMKKIKTKPIKEQIEQVMLDNNESAKLELSQFHDMDEKTLSGIFTELSNNITIFATSEELQNALSGEGRCITPDDLEKGYDIYCCIPEHKLEEWKSLLAMMCNQFLKSFERRSEENQTPILFLIDEFARLGKIEAISNGLATLRSKKIHIALFVQSKAQLNVNYGKDVAEVITDNCSYKAILKASEPTTQEWCSKLVGTYDKEKKSSNFNADVTGMAKGSGTSRTTEEKRIIKPEEFAYLKDVVCIFPNGYKRIEKIKYWEDKAFSNQEGLNNISFKNIKGTFYK